MDMEYIQQLQTDLHQERAKNTELSKAANSMFAQTQDTNLIEWQLELDNILERIDHLLRGRSLKFDKKGNMTWQDAEDKTLQIFNERGVQEVLRILSMYLNRNTILSNYDEPTINWKMKDLGNELADLIFMKYEQFGLETPEKMKYYPIMVLSIVDIVHSAYLRALNGGERESLRTARMVSQTVGVGGGASPISPPQRNFNIFKPSSWGKL